MSIQDYLHEKAEESRHNEIIAYMMFVAGSIFIVGGIISSLSFSEAPNWVLFVPFFTAFTEGMFLELLFLVLGVALIVVGIASGLHFWRDRSWYMKELCKANNVESLTMERVPPKIAARTGAKKKK
jgi:uncharacterized membrane protein